MRTMGLALLALLTVAVSLGFVPGALTADAVQPNGTCYEQVNQYRYSKYIEGTDEESHTEYIYQDQTALVKGLWADEYDGLADTFIFQNKQWNNAPLSPSWQNDGGEYQDADPNLASQGPWVQGDLWSGHSVHYLNDGFVKWGYFQTHGERTIFDREVKVIDEAAIPGKTVYYMPGGASPTNSLTPGNFTEDVDPEGWTLVDDREIDGEQIPCFAIEANASCGTITASITENNTDFPALLSGVEGSEAPVLNDHPWDSLNSFEVDTPAGTDLVHTFPEDYNDGSVTVTVFAHGPEQDAYAVDGKSPISETLTVITDCETAPPGSNYWMSQECEPFSGTGPQAQVHLENIAAVGSQESSVFVLDGVEYVLASGKKEVVTFNFTEDEGDGSVSIPITVDGVEQDPIVVDTDCDDPVVTTTTTEQPATTTTAAPPTATPDELAETGTETWVKVIAGIVTILAGLGLVTFANRKLI